MSESVPSTLISNLPAASSVSDTDIVVLENGSTTQKITIAQLKEALGINVLNTKIPTQKMYFGTSVYSGTSATIIKFSGMPSGYNFAIASCQDVGCPITVANISGTTLEIVFSSPVTLARVNYLLFTQ